MDTNFQPMPKRFMVWEKDHQQFARKVLPGGVSEYVYTLPEMSFYYDDPDCIICQSTNLFDKDGKEIFEGSIVIDDYLSYPDHKKGQTIQPKPVAVLYDKKTARFVLDFRNKMDLAFKGGNECRNLRVVGHILSNPELLEER